LLFSHKMRVHARTFVSVPLHAGLPSLGAKLLVAQEECRDKRLMPAEPASHPGSTAVAELTS